MQTLSHSQTKSTSGGLLWSTPWLVALGDSAALGPLVFAFGAGYATGTFIYDTWLSD